MMPTTERASPLGAALVEGGTNFAIFSANAKSVHLLLFDRSGKSVSERIPLTERSGYVWHKFLPGVGPRTIYGYSVDGPYDPGRGHRFNQNKVLLDPYARAVAGPLQWDDSLFGYKVGDGAEDLSFDGRDSSQFAPKGVVVDPSFDWDGVEGPKTPWEETVIYECHVKGLTKLSPHVAEPLRGTYAGLASPPVVSYLKDLGITAVELLPVHHHLENRFLAERGLTNYWGYSTIGYFAPDSRYSSSGAMGEQVTEFKSMVRGLHSEGIEVILDVVYNHTTEGNHLGPTLSFRGIDNLAYYRLDRKDKRFNFDVSGTGNSLNMRNPFVLQMIMDSLRYWAVEMRVDGFRFDLASALGRETYDVDLRSAFFKAVQQDPILSQLKLIAEPWDLGQGGYQLGNFLPPWSEWNDRYRNALRRFWKGEGALLPQVATRLAGSSDLFSRQNRGPLASINYITCHDGFTLNDLVSYNEKHNEANGEGNRDGMGINNSWNCGHEGPSDDPQVRLTRQRQCKNFIATLFLSQGVPMLLAGDEVRRSQGGNNNAYCQDNEVSWMDWSLDEEKREILDFVREMISIRRKYPVFGRRKFFREGTKELVWLKGDGLEVNPEDWAGLGGVLGMRLSGDSASESREQEAVKDESFLLVLNGSAEEAEFMVPDPGSHWLVTLDTSGREARESPAVSGEKLHLEPRSAILLRKTD